MSDARSVFCTACGVAVTPTARFCPACGGSQEPAAAPSATSWSAPGAVARGPVAAVAGQGSWGSMGHGGVMASSAGRERALGSRAARFGASLIDSIVVLVPALLLAAITGSSGAVLVGLIYMVFFVLYAPAMLARSGPNNGQTLGKMACGLRVVLDGEPGELEFGRAFLREFVGRSLLNLVTFGFYGLLDSAWCLWDPRKQTLHDKIGRTLVVDA